MKGISGKVQHINLGFVRRTNIVWIRRPGGRRIHRGAVRKVVEVVEVRPVVSGTVPGRANVLMALVISEKASLK